MPRPSPTRRNSGSSRRRRTSSPGALGRLLVTVERYPELKSNANFLALQSQLEGTENRIAVARRDYIEAVRAYNTELRTIPGRWIAAIIYPNAKPMETFTATAGSDRPPASSKVSSAGDRSLAGECESPPMCGAEAHRLAATLPSRAARVALSRARHPPRLHAAQTFPRPTGRVVDAANLLKPDERAALDAKLKAHEDKTSDQVVVATVRPSKAIAIEDYANRLFRHWKLGQQRPG